ncbi:transferase [Mastigocoleus testarum BC008]|uniref:Transferase n=1 Tax=Mastigocoleus testarum BC008 TaxID=371196 RepID=A0A0V7ZCT2_9CYAN|nr:transferase [Mastigocoleus testarum BC008]KST70288.1 transferase [Mastigocoleus testarum BC008]
MENTNHVIQRQKITAHIVTSLLGGIPRPLGTIMRQFLYKIIFARMGRNVYIQAGSEFLGANAIEIGNDVKIMRDVRLNVKTTNSFIRLGNRVCLDRGVDINVAGEDCSIEIGDSSYLGPYVCMSGPGHIKIGQQCLIASQTGIYANNHREYGLSREGITIEDNCWLGTGVRILDGVTIGRGSVVGAGAVVTKDIPPYSVAVGVPAKRIKASKGGCV